MKYWICFLAALIPAVGLAQPYSVNWFKVAGGGGTITGQVFTVSGTFGQQQAGGPLQNSGFSVVSGFWSPLAVHSFDPLGTAPAMTNQPQSVIVSNGLPAAFNVSVSGSSPLFYQWQKNARNLTDGGNISGATTPNLALSATSATDLGSYRLIIANAYGSITSSVATLTGVLPNITAQPQSVIVSNSAAALFSVSTSEIVPTSYQWRWNGVNLSNGGNISGANSPTLNVDTLSDFEGIYSVVVSNIYGAVTSTVAYATATITSIAAGYYDSLFVKSGGGLWVMGNSGNGQLGVGYSGNVYAPTRIVTNGVVRAGTVSLCSGFFKSGGSLWAMGDNDYGQLGDGTTNSQLSPIQIVPTGVTELACGSYHTLFLKGGSLWGHGGNYYGELGNGTWGNTVLTPQQSVANGVVAIAAGEGHSLFIRSDGSLWAMGLDTDGQMGSTVTNLVHPDPESIVGSGVQAIAAGAFHSLFVKTDGSLWAMGYNGDGELGDGSFTSRTPPVQIVGSDVTVIAAGSYHSLFLKSDGSLWAMGWNGQGQLGDGTSNSTNQPIKVVASGVIAIAAGDTHSLFVKSDGSLWGMGDNSFRQLGSLLPNSNLQPKPVLAIFPTMVSSLANRTNVVGTTASFFASAIGAGSLTYQWQRSGTNLLNGPRISGAQSPSLSLFQVSLTDAGSYTLIVSNPYGSITNSATLVVRDPPVISSQPASRTNNAGTTATFSVIASALGGTPVSFQWRKGGVPLTNGGNISGATNSPLVLNSVSTPDAGGYSVVVTNSYGAVTSVVATLSIRTTAVADSFNVPWNTSFLISPTTLLANDVAGSANGANTSLNFFLTGSNTVSGGSIQATTIVAAVWAKQYAAASNYFSAGFSIAVDGSNDVIVAGNSATAGDTAMSAVKYSNSGTPQWTNRNSQPITPYVFKVAADRDGDIYVLDGQSDFHTLKFSKSGVPLWTNVFTSIYGSDYPAAMSIDTNKDVFVTGWSRRSTYIEGFLTIKYSSAGTPLWTNIYAPALDNWGDSEPAALALDPFGNVIVAGYSSTNYGHADYAVIKYSSAGAQLWARQYAGAAQGNDQATGIVTDRNGNVFVHGYSLNASGTYDYATVAYSSAGLPLWTNRFPAQLGSAISPGFIAGDKLGNVLTAGTHIAGGGLHSYGIFTLKYSNGGVPLWTNYYNSPWDYSDDHPNALTVDTNGNAIIVGTASGPPNYPLTLAISSAGTPLWSVVYSNAGPADARAVATDPTGNVFTTGSSTNGFLTIKYAPTTAYIYSPPVNFIGVDSFYYWIQDSLGIMSTGTVTAVTLPPSLANNQLFGKYNSSYGMLLAYRGLAGSNYAVERTFNLTPPATWVSISTNTADANGYAVFTTPPVANTNNFWRIRSVP